MMNGYFRLRKQNFARWWQAPATRRDRIIRRTAPGRDLVTRLFQTMTCMTFGLTAVLLLTSCASFEPVPETWPKRYREFIQKVDMPIGRRITLYLGLDRSNSPPRQPYDQEIVFYSSKPSPVWNTQIRFNAIVGKVYTGSVETRFSPSVTCITHAQLDEVGEFRPGIAVPMHITNGPRGSGHVTYLPQPDHFVFKLDNDVRVDAIVLMEKGCLTSLQHAISSKPTQ
jgi:hypothetical protein